MSAQPNQLHFVRSHRFSFMSPSGARYRHRPSAPLPVPSEARVDLATEINRATELPSARASVSRLRALDALARGEECSFAALAHGIIPDVAQRFVDRYGERVYGGRFVGEDGKRFVTSCQDPSIRVYETNGCEKRAAWKLTHEIKGLGVHWTITDFDISPDGRWLAYVSLNRLVHVVDLENVREAQTVFDLSVGAGFSVNIWSIKWSHDGSEIVAGTGGNGRSCYGNVIIFDVQLGKIVQVLSAHTDDVNSVCFMRTGERNLILSASDDALGKAQLPTLRLRLPEARKVDPTMLTCRNARAYDSETLGPSRHVNARPKLASPRGGGVCGAPVRANVRLDQGRRAFPSQQREGPVHQAVGRAQVHVKLRAGAGVVAAARPVVRLPAAVPAAGNGAARLPRRRGDVVRGRARDAADADPGVL
ncbi:WD40-repeat containing protein [Chondrus crispus]|uniref:WD40-repeat containing protein n=1 Tax=Chondrus crispus TaxID=2769 RepID=R7QNU5_CHOCR|nr:WD40-repeat containing protein [Chondrus crispus]CDF40172.1 WD40-repeat containing protein [Chondrus crispus]|eukprot:XP_005710466.1 WD40-repeat containing protein [Chondrus crispus]